LWRRCGPSASYAGHVGEGLQLSRVGLGSAYATAMRSELGAAIDRRLADLIMIRLRRAWPLLKLVPTPLIVPIVAPGARRLRRSLSRGAVAVVVSAGAVILLIALRT
jgi:hypothetical protein